MKRIFLLIVLIMSLFTGCGEKNAPDECIEQANQFVSYFKQKDFESMYEMTVYKDPYLAGTYDENSTIGQKLFNAMSESLNFEITGSKQEGDSAYVKAHIVTVDFNKLLKEVVSDYGEYCKENAETITSDQLGGILENILGEALKNTTPYEKDTSIDFVKKDGKWIIEDNVGVYDDLSGGYLTYCFSVNSNLGSSN